MRFEADLDEFFRSRAIRVLVSICVVVLVWMLKQRVPLSKGFNYDKPNYVPEIT